jgi:alkanesulfonate monooxygenase SsuD/methylene tetrahydromethanopterin reductase-like flavin-dependent oxidoreductase (luciferase family)
MRFGIFDHMEMNGGSLGQLYSERLEMLEAADAAGFWCYHKAEHHLTPLDAAPSSNVFLAAASQRTTRIRLGPLVYLLPFYHPVRLIEEICALDHLTNGRLEMGVGRGISPAEHALWGNNAETAREKSEETLAVVLNGLANPTLTHHGPHWSFEDLPMTAQPVQRPHPPIWYPGNVEFAGSHGFHTVVGGRIGVAAGAIARYRELTGGAEGATIGVQRHVLLMRDGDAARGRARQAWASYHHNLTWLWRRQGVETPAGPTAGGDFEKALAAEIVIAGTPEEARDHIRRLRDEAGAGYFVGAVRWGDLTHEEAMETVRLYAEEVIPAFSD